MEADLLERAHVAGAAEPVHPGAARILVADGLAVTEPGDETLGDGRRLRLAGAGRRGRMVRLHARARGSASDDDEQRNQEAATHAVFQRTGGPAGPEPRSVSPQPPSASAMAANAARQQPSSSSSVGAGQVESLTQTMSAGTLIQTIWPWIPSAA